MIHLGKSAVEQGCKICLLAQVLNGLADCFVGCGGDGAPDERERCIGVLYLGWP
jgi:hypothetical protein